MSRFVDIEAVIDNRKEEEEEDDGEYVDGQEEEDEDKDEGKYLPNDDDDDDEDEEEEEEDDGYDDDPDEDDDGDLDAALHAGINHGLELAEDEKKLSSLREGLGFAADFTKKNKSKKRSVDDDDKRGDESSMRKIHKGGGQTSIHDYHQQPHTPIGNGRIHHESINEENSLNNFPQPLPLRQSSSSSGSLSKPPQPPMIKQEIWMNGDGFSDSTGIVWKVKNAVISRINGSNTSDCTPYQYSTCTNVKTGEDQVFFLSRFKVKDKNHIPMLIDHTIADKIEKQHYRHPPEMKKRIQHLIDEDNTYTVPFTSIKALMTCPSWYLSKKQESTLLADRILGKKEKERLKRYGTHTEEPYATVMTSKGVDQLYNLFEEKLTTRGVDDFMKMCSVYAKFFNTVERKAHVGDETYADVLMKEEEFKSFSDHIPYILPFIYDKAKLTLLDTVTEHKKQQQNKEKQNGGNGNGGPRGSGGRGRGRGGSSTTRGRGRGKQ